MSSSEQQDGAVGARAEAYVAVIVEEEQRPKVHQLLEAPIERGERAHELRNQARNAREHRDDDPEDPLGREQCCKHRLSAAAAIAAAAVLIGLKGAHERRHEKVGQRGREDAGHDRRESSDDRVARGQYVAAHEALYGGVLRRVWQERLVQQVVALIVGREERLVDRLSFEVTSQIERVDVVLWAHGTKRSRCA